MKTSHLQLDWVRYPHASYQAIPSEESEFPPAKTQIEARVTYDRDGTHFAWLKLSSGDEPMRGYDFELEAIATFKFDLDIALSVYKAANDKLPRILAVNITRMLYASAREMLAVLTARAPHGSVVIESVLIEPGDVEIGSEVSPEIVLRELFHVETETSAPKLTSEVPTAKKRATTNVKARKT
jgi:hypothetical protein